MIQQKGRERFIRDGKIRGKMRVKKYKEKEDQ